MEKSCHPAKKAMVPTILIDDAEFRIVLYDCDKDVLCVESPNAKILYLYCADQKFSDFKADMKGAQEEAVAKAATRAL